MKKLMRITAKLIAELAMLIYTAIYASAGVTGGVFSGLITLAFNKAKRDAEKKREERLKLELLRLEGEERLSRLMFALLRSRPADNDTELKEAERAYTEYLEKSNLLKYEIISEYTA